MQECAVNKKQKITLYVSLSVILISIIVWQLYGGEIFTKTEVLVEVKDELFGTTKEWQDQFIWGLDLTGIITAASVLIGGILIFVFRTKKTGK